MPMLFARREPDDVTGADHLNRATFALNTAEAGQHEQRLAHHRCINLRLPTAGGLYAWELEQGGRELRVRVEGQMAFNNVGMMLRATQAGLGLACVLEDHVIDLIAEGRLIRVLEDWCPPFAGYHLYYPSRRQPSAGFALLVDALRYRG